MPRLVVCVGAAAMLLLGLALAGSASADAATHQRLQVPNSDLFGFSVALSSDGGVALVGAPNTDAAQGAAFVFVRSGGNWVLQQRLQVPRPPQLGALRFGTSVSLSSDGRTALIGAQGSNPAIGGEDAAYVFVRGFIGGFALQQQLLNPAGAFSGNQFGASVSLSSDGRSALVGAPAPAAGSQGVGGGAVYVFGRALTGLWTPQQRLGGSSAGFDAFGSSVSLSADGRSALIGAPQRDVGGVAYVFARGVVGGFAQQQLLQAADRASGDAFGQSVALSADGRTALIGTPDKDDGPSAGVGAAYVFVRGVFGGFAQQQRLQAADRAAGDQFGDAVSLDRAGRSAVIGALGTDNERGAGYVFSRGFTGGFTQGQTLEAPVRVEGDFFGWSVSVSADGNVSLAGVPEIHDGGPRSGSAYVFTGLG